MQAVNGRKPINSQYAGKTYPAENLPEGMQDKYPNGIGFTQNGYPDFSPHAEATVIIDGLNGNRQHDERLANKSVGLKNTPDGLTWHHVEDGKTMQLVPSDIHRQVRHTGGAAIIK